MAMKPKKSDSQIWGAGSSKPYKSGVTAKVPNPNGNKLKPVKPKATPKPKVTPKPKPKRTPDPSKMTTREKNYYMQNPRMFGE